MAEEIREFNYNDSFPIDWRVPNFTPREFACHHCKKIKISRLLVSRLQAVREYLNKPLKINSGYRCVVYNKQVGGATNSQHIYGRAADFTVAGIQPGCVQSLMQRGWFSNGGVGRYPTFTHVDTWNKRVWGAVQSCNSQIPLPSNKPTEPPIVPPVTPPATNTMEELLKQVEELNKQIAELNKQIEILLSQNSELTKAQEEGLTREIEKDAEISKLKEIINNQLNELSNMAKELDQTYQTKTINKIIAFIKKFRWDKRNLISILRSLGTSVLVLLGAVLASDQAKELVKDNATVVAGISIIQPILANWIKNLGRKDI